MLGGLFVGVTVGDVVKDELSWLLILVKLHRGEVVWGSELYIHHICFVKFRVKGKCAYPECEHKAPGPGIVAPLVIEDGLP